jgi:hypothetical protein
MTMLLTALIGEAADKCQFTVRLPLQTVFRTYSSEPIIRETWDQRLFEIGVFLYFVSLSQQKIITHLNSTIKTRIFIRFT